MSNLLKKKFYFEHDSDGEDKLIQKNTFSAQGALDDARYCRDAGVGQIGEKKLVGMIPIEMVELWLREAGVKMSDTHAASEVLKKKLMDSENNKFRVWEGSY